MTVYDKARFSHKINWGCLFGVFFLVHEGQRTVKFTAAMCYVNEYTYVSNSFSFILVQYILTTIRIFKSTSTKLGLHGAS